MENQDNNQQKTTSNQPAVNNQAIAVNNNQPFRAVQKASAWAMITCAILFAVIAILAIWGVFNNSGDVVSKSLATLAVVAFASLVVNVGVRIYDNIKK